MKYKPELIIEAAADKLALAAGIDIRSPHPLASSITLREIAEACGHLYSKGGQAATSEMAVMGMGIRTGQFSALLATTARTLVARTFALQADYLPYCQVKEVPDFKPVEIVPSVDATIDLQPLAELGQMKRFLLPKLLPGPNAAVLETYAGVVAVTRAAIINDDLGLLRNVLGAAGVSGARKESRKLVDALEANPNLTDGVATFDASRFNVVEGPPTGDGLNAAMGLLRKQPLPSGDISGLRARHLVVSPELEYSARQTLYAAGIEQIDLHVLSHLPAPRWFLMADPALAPTLGLLRLGRVEHPFLVEQARPRIGFDGAEIRVRADICPFVMSPIGLVRGGWMA